MTIEHFGKIKRFKASFHEQLTEISDSNTNDIIQAIGLITANKSLTDHVATDNSADNDDSDTSSYDNSLGNKYIYQNVKAVRAGGSFKINGTAKLNSVPLLNENRTFGIALNIYYNNNSTPEFHYQNFSADTDAYQQVSLSVTPEKTNEIVNYICICVCLRL